MAITPVNYERQIEAALITLIQAEQYIIDNSVPVREWRNAEEENEGFSVIIHVNANEPGILDEAGRTVDRMMQIDLLYYYHNEKNELPSGAEFTPYEFLQAFADQITIAEIETELTGLKINGLHPVTSAEEYGEPFYFKAASLNVHIEQTT